MNSNRKNAEVSNVSFSLETYIAYKPSSIEVLSVTPTVSELVTIINMAMERIYSQISMEGTDKHKHLLHYQYHWKGFTAVQAALASYGHEHKGPPFLTWRTAAMALMVSMGGMIFGYDTGALIHSFSC